MVKAPFQMKNLVEEWAKQWGYTVTDTTKQQVNAPIEWMLEINNGKLSVAIYAPKNSDLLRFQTRIEFSPEHRQKTANLPNEEYNNFVLSITDRLTSMNCDWNFTNDPTNQKQMNDLTQMYFLTYDSADKNSVLQLINKAIINENQMIRAISITLNKGGDPQGMSNQSTKTIYG